MNFPRFDDSKFSVTLTGSEWSTVMVVLDRESDVHGGNERAGSISRAIDNQVTKTYNRAKSDVVLREVVERAYAFASKRAGQLWEAARALPKASVAKCSDGRCSRRATVIVEVLRDPYGIGQRDNPDIIERPLCKQHAKVAIRMRAERETRRAYEEEYSRAYEQAHGRRMYLWLRPNLIVVE